MLREMIAANKWHLHSRSGYLQCKDIENILDMVERKMKEDNKYIDTLKQKEISTIEEMLHICHIRNEISREDVKEINISKDMCHNFMNTNIEKSSFNMALSNLGDYPIFIEVPEDIINILYKFSVDKHSCPNKGKHKYMIYIIEWEFPDDSIDEIGTKYLNNNIDMQNIVDKTPKRYYFGCFYLCKDIIANIKGVEKIHESPLVYTPLYEYWSGNYIIQFIANALLYFYSHPEWIERIQLPVKEITGKMGKRKRQEIELDNKYSVIHEIGIPKQIKNCIRAKDFEGESHKINKRFMVRGHWRNQVCGQGRQERRLQFIAPFWKGTEEMPLIEHVYNIS